MVIYLLLSQMIETKTIKIKIVKAEKFKPKF